MTGAYHCCPDGSGGFCSGECCFGTCAYGPSPNTRVCREPSLLYAEHDQEMGDHTRMRGRHFLSCMVKCKKLAPLRRGTKCGLCDVMLCTWLCASASRTPIKI